MLRRQSIKYGDKRSITLTNMLANSNFASTANWLTYNCSMSVSGNEFTSTATAQYGYVMQQFTVANTHKYYYATSLYATNALAFTSFSDTLISSYGVHSATAGYERISIVHAATANSPNASITAFLETATSSFQQVKGQYAMLIDLTVSFGAGREPSKEFMDRLMRQFPNAWFTGSQVIQL